MARKTTKPAQKSRLEQVRVRLSEVRNEYQAFSYACDKEAAERFAAAGGCRCCNGRGTFRYRPTLDYMNEWYEMGCIYTPESRNPDGSYRGDGFRIDPAAPYCTEQTRAATLLLLCYTDGQKVKLTALRSEIDSLKSQEARLAAVSEPKVDHMVRVYKGRKVPLGDYQCVKAGDGQYGPWLLLRASDGTSHLTNRDNCVGLDECPECRQDGTVEELDVQGAVGEDGPHACCCVCRDRLRDAGLIPFAD